MVVSTRRVLLEPSRGRLWIRIALLIWAAVTAAVVVSAIKTLGRHTVSTVYWDACRQWWHSQEMYGLKDDSLAAKHGFLYFPQAAPLFTPFAFLPLAWAEALWRIVTMGAAAWSLWRLCGMVGGERRGLWFLLATLVGLPTLVLSAGNGQANLPVIALMTLSIVDLWEKRYWRSTLWLALGLALKPHVAALYLMVFVLYPKMRARLVVGGLALAALPWLHPDWHYVWSQHVSFIKKMRVAAQPLAGQNQELVGMLWSAGIELPQKAWLVIRACGALAILGCSVWAKRRLPERAALVYLLSFAVVFIMLFNPRTEGATYAMTGVVLGVFGAAELIVWPGALAYIFVAGAMVMAFVHNFQIKNEWTRPALTLLLWAYLIWHVARGRAAVPVAVRTPEERGVAGSEGDGSPGAAADAV